MKIKLLLVIWLSSLFLSCITDKTPLFWNHGEIQQKSFDIYIENGIGFFPDTTIVEPIYIDSLQVELFDFPTTGEYLYFAFWICEYNPESTLESSRICIGDFGAILDLSERSHVFEYEREYWTNRKTVSYFVGFLHSYEYEGYSGSVRVFYH